MREQIADLEQIEKIVIHTSHHTHFVIGTGANDPQKMDPKASRETLDHSIMYIFAVALQDGTLAPRRQLRAEPRRPRRHRAAVAQDRDARGSGVDAPLPLDRSRTRRRSAAASRSSCRTAAESSTRLAVANAHPLGARPFGREDYIRKFHDADRRRSSRTREANRFLEAAQDLRLPAVSCIVERRPAAGTLAEAGICLNARLCRASAAALSSAGKPGHSLLSQAGEAEPRDGSNQGEHHERDRALPNRAKKGVGLSGVTAGNTALCTVGRTGNDLHYRGYDILDVADTCEFEEIAYLLVHGTLPTRAELAGLQGEADARCAACRIAVKQRWKHCPPRRIRWT